MDIIDIYILSKMSIFRLTKYLIRQSLQTWHVFFNQIFIIWIRKYRTAVIGFIQSRK